MDPDEPAFKVTNPDTGHTFKVWADGRIDGFGDATMVHNRIPVLVAEASYKSGTRVVRSFENLERRFERERRDERWFGLGRYVR